MAALIDSSVLIAAERGALDITTALGEHRDDSFAVSAVTASELLHGVHRVPSSRRATTEAFVEGLLQKLPVVAFDLRCARVHARLWAEAVRSGSMIGERDLMIAATALAWNMSVVTRDLRSFPRVPGLPLLHW